MKLNLDRLAKTRKRKKKTQDEIAAALGFQSRSAYSKRENGVVSLGADELAIIAELLDYDITYFFD
ncbi:helix-turn-helix domain-containing protein [Staphylococcus haemolyticus]|uniref:helix-turn-helix domain-containing protein n=1 Tax=Staphylococcus haemolyticus TaxID=1283 RepID=UPI001F0A0546|nr:helix-turn-helix transcriptional regulator [Staphylococcus haemolyticus]MCH4336042.1 helix-turn-helix domain-containing protein [Staphylococcus haemolyticus]